MFESWMIFAAGVILGAIVANVFRVLGAASGTLKIDCSNPEKDSYMFEVDDLDKLSKKKRLFMRIVRTTNLSPK